MASYLPPAQYQMNCGVRIGDAKAAICFVPKESVCDGVLVGKDKYYVPVGQRDILHGKRRGRMHVDIRPSGKTRAVGRRHPLLAAAPRMTTILQDLRHGPCLGRLVAAV
jgi:hypothetical protein